MLKCDKCGRTFDEEDTITKRENMGEFWGAPAYESIACCPFCGCDSLDEVEEEKEDF